MDVKKFVEKVEGLGYGVVHHIPNDHQLSRLIVSEDNFYHVSIHPDFISKVPFEVIIEFIKKEIIKLKENERTN